MGIDEWGLYFYEGLYMMKYRKLSTEPSDINTALVLSGGGAKGAYQVGVVKQLYEMGISFDLISGTSIGALNGALLSEFIHEGLSNRETCFRLEEAWLGFQRFLSINWSGFLRNIICPSKIPSVYTNKYIKKTLYKYISVNRKFSDYTKCQLSITGTNLSTKELQIFDFNSTTPVVEAVLASMSYPVAFPAVDIDGDIIIDGGALSNAPLKEAIQWGARNIYLVFLRPLNMIKGKVQGSCEDYYSALDVVEEFLDMATNRLMYGDLKRAEQINQVIELLNKYQHRLPKNFVREMRQLYGLKYKEGKRLIKIKQISPGKVLSPPGLKGFKQKNAIKDIIQKGKEDTKAKIL